MYDIAIIGAGPAGATLARLLRNRYKILLVDKHNYTRNTPRHRYKCCGGLLAPDAQKLLSQFGLGLPKEILVSPQIFVVRTIDLGTGRERFYQRHYINLDRQKLDSWLFSLAAGWVTYLPDTILKCCSRNKNGFVLELFKNRRIVRERARIVVGADGAASRVRKGCFPDKKPKKLYLALQEWFHFKRAAPYFSAIFDPAITDFYAWAIPKDDSLLLGAALEPGSDIYAKFSLLKKRLGGYGYQIDNHIRKKGAFMQRPTGAGDICLGEGNLALIGEAAGWISPSSAEGLSYAFRSALCLAQALWPGPDGFFKRYKSRCSSLFRNIFIKNLKSPFMYNRFLRNIILKSGIRQVKLVGS
jgi:geranylgeranyl reductase